MKRWIALGLAAALLVSLFAGCANAPETPASTASGQTSVTAAASGQTTAAATAATTAAAAAYDPAADYPYGVNTMPLFNNVVPVENGYYMILSHFLFYMDSPAMEPVPVCGRPNCLHYFEPELKTLQSCGAYVDGLMPRASLFWYSGKLYRIESVRTINDPEHPRQDALVRTDPDGTNYEIVYRFDPERMAEKGMAHHGYFYVPLKGFDEGLGSETSLYAVNLDDPRSEAECVLTLSYNTDGRIGSPMMIYGDRLYLILNPEDRSREYCIFDLRTRERYMLDPIDGSYVPVNTTFIGDKVYLTCRTVEPQGDPHDEDSYPERLYRCDLDGSNMELLRDGWGDYASDQEYLYRIPNDINIGPEDHWLIICDPDGRELDRVDLYALMPAENILGAGLLIPPGDEAMFFLQTMGDSFMNCVYRFDKSEIGTGHITVHPLLSIPDGVNSDMRGTQMVELDTTEMRETAQKAAATTMAAPAATTAAATAAPAAAAATTALVRPEKAAVTVTPVDMGPFTNAAGVNTGSIQVEDLGIDLGGENVEYMNSFIWGDKTPQIVAPYWENVCEYINFTYNGTIEMQFENNQDYWGLLRARIDAGLAPDVFFTYLTSATTEAANRRTGYDSLVSDGALLALDGYTDSLLSRSYAKTYTRLYDNLIRGGSLYGIIQYHRMFRDGWVLYDKVLTDAAGVEIGLWTHYSDLWEPLRAVREWTDVNMPDRSDTATAVLPIDWVEEGGFRALVNDVRGCIGHQYAGCERVAGKAAETEAFNLYDCPEFTDYLKNVSQLVSDRVLREGDQKYLFLGAEDDADRKDVEFVLWYERNQLVPLQEAMPESMYDKGGVEWASAPRAFTLPDHPASIYRLNVVSAGTEAPEAACGLIEILNNDPYVGTTLRFGLEGKDWVRREDGHVNRDPGHDGTRWDSGTSTGAADGIGDITNRLVPDMAPLNLADILQDGHEKMLYSVNTGFLPDLTAVTAEQDAVKAVLNEYLTDQMLYSGLMPPAEIDAAVTEFVGKLNAAGAERIRAEVQRQLDIWRAGR